MARGNRSSTRGNTHVDFTVLRENLSTVNPVVASTLRNAVPTNGRNPNQNELTPGNTHVNSGKLEKLSNMISSNINAGAELRQITPYIDKAELIWETIMLHPNGWEEKTLTYDTRPSRLKNDKLHEILKGRWDNYYTNDYKIEQDLRPMLRDMLWNTGSYCLFNLSRPGLDYLINGSEMIMESGGNKLAGVAGNEDFGLHWQNNIVNPLQKEFVQKDGKYLARNTGRFVKDPNGTGSKRVSGLEALFNGEPEFNETEFNIFGGDEFKDSGINITLTDNPAILYLAKIEEKRRAGAVSSVVGQEDFTGIISKLMAKGKKPEPTPKPKGPQAPKSTTKNLTEQEVAELSSKLFPNRNPARQYMQFVKPQDTLSDNLYGRGLKFHVPSEAVMTIHRQGQNGVNQDYIFLLGDDGYFLQNTHNDDFYPTKNNDNTAITNKSGGGSTNQLIHSLKLIQEGKDCDIDMTEFAELSSTSVIRQFMSSVVSGDSGNISISIDEETNKIFLARMLKGQSVRCLYVPGESVTYMALKYNKLGIGQSLTQSAKMHIARLAALDLADALANLESAQPHTLMTIGIKEDDPDPTRTVALARATHFNSNPRLHSILQTSTLAIPQIVDALRESSLTIKVDPGDNKHMPAADINIEHMEKQTFKPVDQSSREEVLNKICGYFGLSRSWLDIVDGGENNFQIEALVEHQMLLNQGINWQKQWCEMIIDHERKHAMVNAYLLGLLVQDIIDNKSLWTPDSKEELVGTDEQKVQLILSDFLNNLTASLPAPANTESTNKLKDKLTAINDLVTAWMDMSGYLVSLPSIAKSLGLDDGEFAPDQIKETLKAIYMTKAFKRYNLPMPFDDVVAEGLGGGMASIINAITHQRTNLGEFLGSYVVEISNADKKTIKSHKKKVQKALDALAALEEPPEEPTDGGEAGGGNELNDDGNAPADNADDSAPVDDGTDGNENEEEEEPETPEEPEEPDANADGGADNDGLDPAKNKDDENPF